MAPDGDPPGADAVSSAASMRVVTRFVSWQQRKELVAAIAQGRLTRRDQLDLLAQEHLPELAKASLRLLLGAAAGFTALNLAARWIGHVDPLFGAGSPVVRIAGLVLGNIAAYAVILPVHEAIHAAVILGLGGRPRFGLKLPWALYCSAPGQLFTRNGYIVVALAPLMLLTVAGAAVTWVAPNVGAYIVFGLVGNVAGAVGDLECAARLRHLPRTVLIEDTQTGYTAFQPHV